MWTQLFFALLCNQKYFWINHKNVFSIYWTSSIRLYDELMIIIINKYYCIQIFFKQHNSRRRLFGFRDWFSPTFRLSILSIHLFHFLAFFIIFERSTDYPIINQSIPLCRYPFQYQVRNTITDLHPMSRKNFLMSTEVVHNLILQVGSVLIIRLVFLQNIFAHSSEVSLFKKESDYFMPKANRLLAINRNGCSKVL